MKRLNVLASTCNVVVGIFEIIKEKRYVGRISVELKILTELYYQIYYNYSSTVMYR
jgi:hypothetical protein